LTEYVDGAVDLLLFGRTFGYTNEGGDDNGEN
jgi:hypothetical protein